MEEEFLKILWLLALYSVSHTRLERSHSLTDTTPLVSVLSTLNLCVVISVILKTPFLSGSLISSTSPVLTELVIPTFTDVNLVQSAHSNFNAKKFPSPARGPDCASPPSTNLSVPVISLALTSTSSCRLLTAVSNTTVSPLSALTVRPKRNPRSLQKH